MTLAATLVGLLTQTALPQSWQTVDNFQAVAGDSAAAQAIGRDPSGNLYAAGYAFVDVNGDDAAVIRKSSDGGLTWSAIANVLHFPKNHLDPNPDTQCTQVTGPVIPSSPGLSDTTTFRDHTHGIDISPVAPNPSDPTADGKNHIAVVGTGGLVATSHDGGATWHETHMIGTVPFWAGSAGRSSRSGAPASRPRQYARLS